MLHRSLKFVCAALVVFVFALFATRSGAAGEVGAHYVVEKSVAHQQTDPTTVTLGSTPYHFDTVVQAASNGSLTAGTVTLPDGTTTKTLGAANDGTGAYGFSQKFADQSTLNSTYPDGNYTLHMTGASSMTYTALLSLTGGVYPAEVPQFSNTNWSGGNLIVDPSAPFTLNWNLFADGTSSDMIVLDVRNISTNQTLFQQFLPASTTSHLFAASFFQPNQSYDVGINFMKVAETNTQDIQSATGFATYSESTDLTIQTVPEPSTIAMLFLGSGCASGLTVLRRRRRG